MNRRILCWMSGALCAMGAATLLTGVTARRIVTGRVRTLAADVPQFARDHPVRRYHDPVTPRRLDAWHIIGPGGGGTFYAPAISPHDPDLVFATSDMTQCFVSEDGGATWREFNLRGPCHVTFDPVLPHRVYANTAGGGLFRSDDRGHAWSLLYPDPSIAGELKYLDDESEPLIYNGTYPPAIQAFAIDPSSSSTLYSVIPGELRISVDSGAHWRKLAECPGAQTIYVDPNSPAGRRTLYLAGGNTAGVWDGVKYTGNLHVEGSDWFYGVAYGTSAATGATVMYTANDFVVKNGVLEGGGILSSSDGGRSWRSLNDGLLKLAAKGSYPEFTTLATSHKHPEVLYVSYYRLRLPGETSTQFGVAKSSDGGATWTLVRKESAVNADNMHDSWIGDYGPDFGDQPLNIAVDDNNPDLVYTSDLGRIMRSSDGGRNWTAVYSQGTDGGYTTTGLDVTTCYGLHFDPFDPRRMFISYTDIGLFRSEDGGKSWIRSANHGVPHAWANTTYWLAFDPAVKDKMWAVMSGTHDLPRLRMFQTPGSTAQFHGGVVASSDGGKTWSVSSKGLPDMAPTHILLDPRSPAGARVLYVTGFGRGVYKSTDGGVSWTLRNTGLPTGEPLVWRMAMDRDGVLYVVQVRRSEDGKYGTDRDGWLYRSRDGAQTWERVPLPEGLNGPVGITVDLQDSQRLYLAAWARYTRYSAGPPPPQGGVFVSSDGGQHWTNTLDASRRIYDVTVDPRDPNLVYAAGFEAAAWRSTDRGRTWSRIRGFNFKDAHRVIPDPLDSSQIYITTFGSSVWHGPAAGDPHAPEDIVGPPFISFDAPNAQKK